MTRDKRFLFVGDPESTSLVLKCLLRLLLSSHI
jgi:hypothetical protein